MDKLKKFAKGSLMAIGVFFILIMFLGTWIDEEPKEEPIKVVKEEKKPEKKEEKPKEEPKEEAAEEKKTPTTPAPVTPTQNFTVDSFTTAINTVYQESHPDNENPNHTPEFSEEEQTATYILSPNAAILAEVNENGIVKKVSVVKILEGASQLDDIEFILAMAVVTAVLNPELDAEARGSFLMNDLKINEVLENGNDSTLSFQGSNIYEFISNTMVGGVQLMIVPSTSTTF